MTYTIGMTKRGRNEVIKIPYCKIHKITYRYFCPRCQKEKRYKRANLILPRMPYGSW